MMWGYGWGFSLGMGVTMVLFWELVISGIVALVRYVGGTRDTSRPTPASGKARPDEVLAERLARAARDSGERFDGRELETE